MMQTDPVAESGTVSADRPRMPVRPGSQVVARHVLVPFILTFISSRVLVFLIVARRVPDLYLHLGGTHIHHLNYGIFLLAAVGAYLLLARPNARILRGVAAVYGVGLALTFDEFDLWFHLGGSYWQRASFDAVVVIGGLLGLVAPTWHHFRPHHWATAVLLLVAVSIFGVALVDSFDYADQLLLRIQIIEQSQPRCAEVTGAISVCGESPRRLASSRFATSTSMRYVAVAGIRNMKYEAGSLVNPKSAAMGIAGSTMPTATIASVVIVSHRLGRLRNGLPIVRITKRTSVCVASDSTNHPVWNKGSLA
jgi:hypothetical protein